MLLQKICTLKITQLDYTISKKEKERGITMVNTKRLTYFKDYNLLVSTILSNPAIYPTIDEEYNKYKKIYDELLLKKNFCKNKKLSMIPETMTDYAIKLTGIFLSETGNSFLDKLLQIGWQQLYDYIKNCDAIHYEEITQLNDFGLKDINENYMLYIVKLISDIFNKKIICMKIESRQAIHFFDKRNELISDFGELVESFKEYDEHLKLCLTEIYNDKKSAKRFICSDNVTKMSALINLLNFYDISGLQIDTMESSNDKDDMELLTVYFLNSENPVQDITKSSEEKTKITDFIIIGRYFQALIRKYKSLYNNYLELYEDNLKSYLQFKKDIDYQIDMNKKIKLENEELKEEIKRLSAEELKKEQAEIISLKKQYEETIDKMSELIDKKEEELKTLKITMESLLDESRYVDEEQIINDALTGTRGVIIGGTPQWQQHMRKIVPHFKFVGTEQLNYDTKILENADKIYFNTAYNSHAMFYKTMNAVRKNKTEIVFINSNSVTAGFKMFGQKSGQYTGEHLVS